MSEKEIQEEYNFIGVVIGIVIVVMLIIVSFSEITVRINNRDVNSNVVVESPELAGDELESIFFRDFKRSFVNTLFINPRIYVLHTFTLFSKTSGNDMKIRIIGKKYPKPFGAGVGWGSGKFVGWIVLIICIVSMSNAIETDLINFNKERS